MRRRFPRSARASATKSLKQETLEQGAPISYWAERRRRFLLTEFGGDDAEAHEVFDCLSTVALFGTGRRLDAVVRERLILSRGIAACWNRTSPIPRRAAYWS